MASGDVVGAILMSLPTSANRADPGILAGATTTTGGAERWPIISFDDDTQEYWDFLCALEGYDSGGLTVELSWAAAATTGAVKWDVAIRAIPSDAEDLDTTDHTYAFNSVTVNPPPSVVGEVLYSDVTFTDGADMDSLADGERFMLRVSRDPGVASDMTGDARLLWPAIIIRET